MRNLVKQIKSLFIKNRVQEIKLYNGDILKIYKNKKRGDFFYVEINGIDYILCGLHLEEVGQN